MATNRSKTATATKAKKPKRKTVPVAGGTGAVGLLDPVDQRINNEQLREGLAAFDRWRDEVPSAISVRGQFFAATMLATHNQLILEREFGWSHASTLDVALMAARHAYDLFVSQRSQ